MPNYVQLGFDPAYGTPIFPFYVVISLDLTPPQLNVVPAEGTVGQIPFTIYFTSDEPATVYYKVNGGDPDPGQPGTMVSSTPFQITLNSPGSHTFAYMTLDDVGNMSAVKYITYYTSASYALYKVYPPVGPTIGGTIITVTGDGLNFGAKILIDREAIPTEYGGNHKVLYGSTLPKEEGSYNVQIDDPLNGLSTILLNAFTYVEPKYEERLDEVPLEPGEVRKHVFQTDVGPMILIRSYVENYDVDNLTESRVNELGVKLMFQTTEEHFPGKITVE